MLKFLTAEMLKFVSAGLLITSFGLGLWVQMLRWDIGSLEKEINDPVNGYMVQLDRSRGQAERLKAALDNQNAEVQHWREEAEQKKGELAKRLAEADRLAEQDKLKMIEIMSRPLLGKDVCARVIEIDGRLLETLK